MNNIKDLSGNNVVMYAAVHKMFDLVNYFSVRGLPIDVEDREGKSLLLHTVLAENYELATKLISRGASVDF